ncbi:MAG TPA: TonB-dependent receptor [Opitutaceae bacterium]|nr:TonB-dependent receptor [Opitutaceae bacterium]
MVSLWAISAGAFFCGAVFASAQTATTNANDAKNNNDETVVLEEFRVTSVRGSLISAQEIKQSSPQFVDSIVAQDIGKLPDNTVADALQRIAGVQVARAAGEANTPVIRGLPAIETTVNGYEVYTGTLRGVSLQDIPAEMLAGLDVYKSVGPEQIEGGVAGLIDIRLRRPFDFKMGLTTAINVRGMYSTQADKNSYFLSGVVNQRWKNENGEFGVLFDVSYQKRHYEDQIFDNWVHYPELFDVATDASGKSGYFGDNFGYQVVPGNRERPAAELAFQWRTNAGIELYSETMYTGYRNDHQVNFFIGIPSWGGTRSNVTLYPAGYAGVKIPDPHSLNGPNTDALFVKSFTATNTNTLTSMQALHDRTDTIQGAFGAKYDKDMFKLTAEVSYNISTVKTRGVILDTGTNSPTETLEITYNDASNPTVHASGLDFADGNNFFINQLFDQWSRAYSHQYAVKTDALIRLKNDFVSSLKFGVRYADRKVNYHQANSSPTGNPAGFFATPTSTIPGLGGVFTNDLFASAEDMSIRKWWSASSDFLLHDTDKVRAAVGLPAGNPPADPASTFNDQEKTFGVYGLANYNLKFGNTPVDGLIGARFVDTHQSLGGYQHPVDASGNSGAGFERVENSSSDWQVLPTFNGRVHFTDELLLRYSATKTITRPNFTDLNPALSLQHSGPTSQVGTGTGGNPKLSPVKSTNYDLGLEYYFAKSSLVSVTGFYRTLHGYVQNFATIENVAGVPYNITRPQNTGKGTLKGLELTYQQFFDFLPGALKGFGVQANYTYIDGKTDDPAHPGTQQQITQVAKNNYNAILIYERGPFSSRLAYTWRGTYIDSYNQPGFQPNTVYVQPTQQLDFSASYDLTKQITLTFDATNLLKSKYHDRFGPTAMFNRDVRSYDTTFAVGARFRF